MIRHCHLSVCGLGAVTPHGIGVPSLLDRAEWKTSPIPALGKEKEGIEAFCVDLQQEKLKQWQQHPRLRRVSPITLFMMEAAQQALGGAADADMARVGVVAALSSGCIVYTRRFFQDFLRDGRRFASPQLFPETVYNAPASHVAAVLGIPGPCSSVGDGSAWVTAIATAAGWLALGQVDHVLVLGAEELDSISIEAFKTAGWLKKNQPFVPAEGAGAILLRLAQPSDRLFITAVSDGYHYRTRKEALWAASACVEGFGEDGRQFYCSAQNNWMGPVERQMSRRLGNARRSDLPYCGEAFSASAAWHTLRALAALDQKNRQMLVPVWGLNEQVSALQVMLAEKNPPMLEICS